MLFAVIWHKRKQAVNPIEKRQLGSSLVTVTRFGFGGGTLGDPTEIISEQQAEDTIQAAWDQGVRYFDTAPWYGNTKSEHRLGHFLRSKTRDDFVLSTKVGRVYARPKNIDRFTQKSPWARRWKGGLPFDLRFDYTYDGIMRSYEDSLQRLGLPRVDCLTIHDLDTRHHLNDEGVRKAFRQLDQGRGFVALQNLKDQGEIGAIGVGINMIGFIPKFAERFPLDYFLLAGPYTLLDQAALDIELPICEDLGISIILGAVFASGILATGAVSHALFQYQPASKEAKSRVREICKVCDAFNVDLAASALQFTLHHPMVASVIPGANHPSQVTSNFDQIQSHIPDGFWTVMKQKGYLRRDSPTP
jgi:D-threo-aldose 1-dehydrogenase